MKTIMLILLFAFVLVISCKKSVTDNKPAQTTVNSNEDEDLTAARSRLYIIYKGDYYCTPNPFVLTTKNKIAFTAVFDSSCIYATTDPHNQNDINKLYGFSDCNDHHLVNSARIGWRWSKDSLRLFGYVHNENNIIFQEITTAQIGSVITGRINCLANSYYFEVNGKTVLLPRHCSGKYPRYKLFPYFGGDETAPHDIKIVIQEIIY
jgi:hypothetical protein